MKEEFFERFGSSCPYISLSDKRGEDGSGRHARPHICIGASHKALLWMAPISSRVEKYEREIAWQRQKYGACDKVQIVRLSMGKRAALIQNIIPCTPRYIDGEYTNRQTGLVEHFPTLIVCGFTALAALLSFFNGMVLDSIKQKEKREFEFRLSLLETVAKLAKQKGNQK